MVIRTNSVDLRPIRTMIHDKEICLILTFLVEFARVLPIELAIVYD